MQMQNNIYAKLNEARKIIRETPIKKEGFNDYGKYEFFTPSQIEGLVADACEKTGTMCLTNLKQDQFGYFQTLRFMSVDEPELYIDFELRTERPDITATNASQKMGGMDTFSERYIKMKVFTIRDNNLDFDSQNNAEKPPMKSVSTTFVPKKGRKVTSTAENDPGYQEPEILL